MRFLSLANSPTVWLAFLHMSLIWSLKESSSSSVSTMVLCSAAFGREVAPLEFSLSTLMFALSWLSIYFRTFGELRSHLVPRVLSVFKMVAIEHHFNSIAKCEKKKWKILIISRWRKAHHWYLPRRYVAAALNTDKTLGTKLITIILRLYLSPFFLLFQTMIYLRVVVFTALIVSLLQTAHANCDCYFKIGQCRNQCIDNTCMENCDEMFNNCLSYCGRNAVFDYTKNDPVRNEADDDALFHELQD